MMHFYNDTEPSACAWLRQLMAEGLIPEGVVCERPIQELDPEELRGFVQCHFFAGIGGWARALYLAGWPADEPVWTGSCPCQPFSAAGKRKGGEDSRHLWPAFFRLVRECRPGTVLGEQVAGAAGYDWLARVSADLESADYRVGAASLCAASVGAPHIRARLFWVAGPGRTGDERECGSGDAPGQDGTPAREAQQRQRGRSDAGSSGTTVREQWACYRCFASYDRPGHADGELAVYYCPACRGATGRLADLHGGQEQCGEPAPRRHDAGGCGAVDGVDQPHSTGLQGGQPGDAGTGDERPGRLPPPGRSGDGSGVGDTDSAREGAVGGVPARPGTEYQGGADFWADSVLIHCRDGKARRISPEPLLFPLAHGLPGRVGLLRGAGNAIVPQVAALFVRAYLEAKGGL